ncbi:MAG: sigma 54-interacting transcriptional regulator [Gemmatimonadales bacterium]
MPQQLAPLFGASVAVTKVLNQSARFAGSRDPILILGERGTGKSALARHIHVLSRRPGAFVEESAAAIPKDMEAVHLTGHARGAFTGAHDDRKGLLEAAHQGTFFLDEVGLASEGLQQTLLRLIENPSLRRLGELRERTVDVRLIAATNEDLEKRIAQGSFRADLWDRLGCMVLRLPRLVDRKDEILPLAVHFLTEAARERGLSTPPALSPRVQDFFVAAQWPGNIRELRSVCRTALLLAHPRDRIDLDDLPLEFVAPLGDIGRARRIQATDKQRRLQEALEQADGNKAKAATRHQPGNSSTACSAPRRWECSERCVTCLRTCYTPGVTSDTSRRRRALS